MSTTEPMPAGCAPDESAPITDHQLAQHVRAFLEEEDWFERERMLLRVVRAVPGMTWLLPAGGPLAEAAARARALFCAHTLAVLHERHDDAAATLHELRALLGIHALELNGLN